MIYGFMHVYPVNNWKKIVGEQFEKMEQSGLLRKAKKIFVGINGDDEGWISSINDKVEVIYQFSKPELEQSLTLQFIRLFASMQNFDGADFFYIHTKGVTHYHSVPQTDWRHLMEHFILTRWKECFLALENCDVVGVNWHLGEGYMNASAKSCGGVPVTPHFSGNFWWATSEYLRTLPPLFPLANKYQCEFWIGMKNPKVTELWKSGIHHHRHSYSESNYEGKKYVRLYSGADQVAD